MRELTTEEKYLKRARFIADYMFSGDCVLTSVMKTEIVGCSVENSSIDIEFELMHEMGNQAGIVHGGVLASIADNAMAIGISFTTGEFHGTTVDMVINYINPVPLKGKLLARAYCQRYGNNLRRARADFFYNGTLMLTAMGNYTGKTMAGGFVGGPIDDYSMYIGDGNVRYFMLEGEKSMALIDTGISDMAAPVLALSLPKQGKKLMVINTHADRDHFAGNGHYENIYMGEGDIERYREKGGKGNPKPLHDGDIINLGDRPLKIIELPGHTEGSVAVLDINSRRLFAGDTVSDAPIYMFGEGRDMKKLIESYKKLLSMREEFDVIECCHGTMELKPDIIEKLLEAAIKINEGKAGEGIDTELHGQTVKLIDFGSCKFYTL